ncbi:extracellular catalytic domain type 1 short-chain-length polyhydroxyalkanoate depolymerase [Methylomagnum sp.]
MSGINTAMTEATRLTRAGRLQEAADLIQRALQGQSAPATPNTPADEAIDGEFRVVGPELAIAPPSAGQPDHSARPAESTESAEASAASTPPPRDKSGGLSALRQSIRNALGKSVLKPKPDLSNRDVWAGGRFIEGTFTNEFGTRAYKLYIPSAYTGQALPLVVMLHGCTQNSDDFAAGTQMNALAERERCFVLYPEQSAQAHPNRCWNWFKASDQRRGHGEPALLAGLTREVIRAYRLDERRVYAAGLSAGGAMAMVLGVTYPDLYAAIGVHSGLPYGAAHDTPSAFAAMQGGHSNPKLSPQGQGQGSGKITHPVPAIVFHGDRDATVHPGNGDQVLAQWTKAHAGGGSATKLRVSEQRGQAPGGHGYTRALYRAPGGQVVLEHWRIHGAGHAWSGGGSKGSYTDPKGPDAAEAMLRFFLQHGRNPA